jgi:hypothetical protein
MCCLEGKECTEEEKEEVYEELRGKMKEDDEEFAYGKGKKENG